VSPLIETALYAGLGGILPVFVWLWFWLREDRLHPEPRKYLVFSFVLGMIAVPLVLPFESFAYGRLFGLSLILSWALIEEGAKLIAAYIGGLHRRAMDEPIDALIYLITAALGFAALENAFFLFSPLAEGNVLLGILTGNIRFIGATLLHTFSSALVGIGIAFTFFKSPMMKWVVRIGSFALAVALHALFNYRILNASGTDLFIVFAGVWVGIIALIVAFERVKRVRRQTSS